MNKFSALIILLVPTVLLAAPSARWLEPITLAARTASPVEDIPESDFFEVAASKEDTAEYWLKDKTVLPQSQDDVRFFGQKNFQCSAPKHLYLVRAEYENGGTGSFMLKRYGSNLLVAHGSLGSASEIQRSALVVCLSFLPTGVFSEISGAM